MMRIIDRHEVRERLTYEACIPLVREAMVALSKGTTKQVLRSIVHLSEGRLFGVMSGAMAAHEVFGAKLISAFEANAASGARSHQGVIVLFDPDSGAPVCIVDAGEITAIRTAAASAVATDALARPNAHKLALVGCGEQAVTHARAIGKVRAIDAISVWGRSTERAHRLALDLQHELGTSVTVATGVRSAIADADIICTVSGAKEPLLEGGWVQPGTHLNLVGSSHAGAAEVDSELVARSRFVADSREGVLAQGGEFLRARSAGIIDDGHIVAEIGEVLSGEVEGRQRPDQITAYKSLGHIVQDLATAWSLYEPWRASPPLSKID